MSIKRYRYRAYPTAGQHSGLARLFGCVRVVFNDYIAAREHLYSQGRHEEVPLTQTAQQVLTVAKTTAERDWLSEVCSVALQQSVRDAGQAYSNYFDSKSGKRKGRKMGKPRFKSRRDRRQAARFTRNAGFSVHQTTHGVGKVRIPKVGWVRFNLSRPLPADPSSVTIIREADGAYFVSFVVDLPSAEQTEPVHPDRAAGIDLGLSDFAAITYTDGTREKVANPRHLKARQRKLTRAQRSLSRKRKGSANRDKARAQVARQHRRVRDARSDFHHQLTHRLIRENQAVAVEELTVDAIARSMGKGKKGAGFRRSVHDAGWGQFLALLADKSAEQGQELVRVNPAYTSQTCSVCVRDTRWPQTPGRAPVDLRRMCLGLGPGLQRRSEHTGRRRTGADHKRLWRGRQTTACRSKPQ